MISSTLDRIAVQTNTSATETRVMGIHAEALAAVTDSMTNLYSNPHLAVLREYSTNAWDAIIAAGSTSPVRVSLPDELDPRLVVSDDGIGMSKDEVLTFFSQYGASNKRDVNTQIGSFGFGCKAAFAIADQFVVTAVRDHYRTVALFARNSEGIGTASIMSHEPTEAANGVEVAVPVNDTDAMCRAATTFFAAWEPGTVEVDGEEFRSLSTVGVRIGDVRLLSQKEAEVVVGSSNCRTHVVMGNVSYPVAPADADGCWNYPDGFYNTHTYIYAGIGDVDIVPSREGLRNTDRTKAFLRAAQQRFDAESMRYVEALIASCPTWYDAAAILHRHDIVPCVTMKRNTFTWRGHRLSTHTSLDAPVLRLDRTKTRIAKPDEAEEGGSTFHIINKNILAITGVTPDTERSVRLGLRALCVQEGFIAVVLCERADYTHEWFTLANPGVTVMTMAECKAARKAALKANASPRAAAGPLTYQVVARGCATQNMSLTELRELPVLAYTDAHYQHVQDAVRTLECDTPVVVLSARQSEGVFRRRLPAARPLTAVLDQAVAAIIATFTPAQVATMTAARRVSRFTGNDTRIARLLRPVLGSITNPEVAGLVDACTTEAGSPATERLRLLSSVPLVRMSTPWLAFEATLTAAAGGDVRGFIDRFPLLESVRYSFDPEKLPHVVAYLNAVTSPPVLAVAA